MFPFQIKLYSQKQQVATNDFVRDEMGNIKTSITYIKTVSGNYTTRDMARNHTDTDKQFTTADKENIRLNPDEITLAEINEGDWLIKLKADGTDDLYFKVLNKLPVYRAYDRDELWYIRCECLRMNTLQYE